MEKETINEATLRNLTDREFIEHVLRYEPRNYFAVQAALRLEAALDAAEDTD